MDDRPENMSDCPFFIETRGSGFAPDPVAALECSLDGLEALLERINSPDTYQPRQLNITPEYLQWET